MLIKRHLVRYIKPLYFLLLILCICLLYVVNVAKIGEGAEELDTDQIKLLDEEKWERHFLLQDMNMKPKFNRKVADIKRRVNPVPQQPDVVAKTEYLKMNMTNQLDHYEAVIAPELLMSMDILANNSIKRLTKTCDDEYFGFGGYKACPCVPESLEGQLTVNFTIPTWSELESKFPLVYHGGEYNPPDCYARQKVAIIIPYKDREPQLKVLLLNLHAVLQHQEAQYRIFVVELPSSILFNRALAMNIGYLEAWRLFEADCFIFHDVDLLTQDDRLLYRCKEGNPVHLCEYIDKHNYEPPYTTLFGGVVAITRKDFESVNGYSNNFYGWGGEDDDLSHRFTVARKLIFRPEKDVSRYHAIKHHHEKGNARNAYNLQLLLRNLAKAYSGYFFNDGISTLEYKVSNMVSKTTYTHIYANAVTPLDNFTVSVDRIPSVSTGRLAWLQINEPLSLLQCASICLDEQQRCNAFIYILPMKINQCILFTIINTQTDQGLNNDGNLYYIKNN